MTHVVLLPIAPRFQERAVVSRAEEMRGRRGRLENKRLGIQGLLRRAGYVLSSPSQQTPPQSQPPEESSAGISLDLSLALTRPPLEASGAAAGNGEERWVSRHAEEAVIEDAEGGVRLMPVSRGESEETRSDGVDIAARGSSGTSARGR